MLWLLLACSLPDDAPACTNEPLQACSDVQVMQVCTDMYVMGGLAVTFAGAAPDTYDAVVTIDGEEHVFSCAPDVIQVTSGSAWSCDANGFNVDAHGDEVTVAVTVDGVVTEESFEPCWDASEPNGRCCGWTYVAEVTLDFG